MAERARVSGPPVVAVLGKGGAGKTVLTALLGRTLLERGIAPLLLVDADPAGGLLYAVGAEGAGTLAGVKARVLDAVGSGLDAGTVAAAVDFRLLEVLEDRGPWSLLAVGRTEERGCFCPLSSLLRAAVETLSGGFRAVVVDGEAGVEQLARQVLRRIDLPVVVTDGSHRGLRVAAEVAASLARHVETSAPAGLVVSRGEASAGPLPQGLEPWGVVPWDEQVARCDREGRSLLADLPGSSPALDAVRELVRSRVLPTVG